MPVVSVTEIGRQGSWTWNRFQRQFERHYQVICDANDDLEGDVLAELPFLPGDSIGAGVYCVKSEVRQQGPDDSGAFFVWQGTCLFDSVLGEGNGAKIGGNDPSTYSQDPLSRQPVFEYDFETLTKAITYGVNGIPIVNSANMPFSPPVEVTYGIGVINIEVNKTSVPNLGAYFNHMNNASVTWDGFSYSAYTLLVTGAKARHVWENNTHYVKVNWTVKYNSETWYKKVIDAGFYELSGIGSGSGTNAGCVSAIMDSTGLPVSGPFLLDRTGRRLPCGEDPPEPLSFQVYSAVSFSGML